MVVDFMEWIIIMKIEMYFIFFFLYKILRYKVIMFFLVCKVFIDIFVFLLVLFKLVYVKLFKVFLSLLNLYYVVYYYLKLV